MKFGQLFEGYFGMTVIATAGMGVSMLLSYLFHVVMVRMLPPMEYGDLATIVAFMVIISMPVMSVQGLISREIVKLEKKGRTGEAESVVRRYVRKSLFLGALVSIVLSALTLIALGFSPFSVAVVVVIFSIPFAYGAAIVNGYFQGKEKIVHLSVLTNLPPAIKLLISVVLVYFGLGMVGATLSFPLGYMAVLVPVALYFGWLAGDGKGTKLDIKNSFVRILSTNILMIVFIYLDLFVVRLILGAEPAAYYNTAGITAKIPFYVGNAAIFVLLPQVSKLTFKDGNELLKRFLMSLAFIVPFAPLFVFLAHPLLSFFYSQLYADMAYGAFGILTIAMVIFSAGNFLVNILWSQRKETFPLILSAAIIPVHLALLYYLVPLNGLAGAATATLAASVIFFAASAIAAIYYSLNYKQVVK
ncbi:MAG: oligosaccharide flippase family protein [Candidatus Micrarchaeota archaeon]